MLTLDNANQGEYRKKGNVNTQLSTHLIREDIMKVSDKYQDIFQWTQELYAELFFPK